MKISGIVPARFLTIVAHVVILIVLFWAKDENIKQCLPVSYTQSEYDAKDLEMIIGLSVGLGLMLIELIGFIGGISMFMPFQSMLSISAHCGACVALAYFILWNMPCHRFWYVFGFSNALPAFTEAVACHTGAVLALFFFLFEFWPCTYYWYIFGFCSAFPAVTEIVVWIGVACFRKGI